MSRNYEIDMKNGPILSRLVTFFVPLMLSSVLQLLFNAVDLMVVGKFAGNDALASVGATTALINVFTNLLIGVSLGANVIAARFIACEDPVGTSKTVHTSITVALVLGFGVMGLGLAFARTCLGWMGTPDNVIGGATLYMRIYFCGMPFFMLYNYGAAILRAAGDTRRPLIILICAGVINAVLNMVLVIRFHLDVAGVAIATVFSQLVSSVCIVWCLCTSRQSYRLEFRKLAIDLPILRRIVAVGIPAGLQSTVINFSNVLLQSSVNSVGSIAMAGYTAANNMLGFLYASCNAITQACMSFTSQNIAVRKFDRVKRIIWDCIGLETGVLLLLGTGAYVFGRQLLGIYADDPAVIERGMEVLRYTTITYFLCGIMDCLPGAMRGMGHSAVPMVLSILGTVGTRIVWIFGLFPHHRSLSFLFISYPASWILTVAMQTLCLVYVYRKETGHAPLS